MKNRRYFFSHFPLLSHSAVLTVRLAVQARVMFFILWAIGFSYFSADPLSLLLDYGAFLFLGFIGAVFANATGAGGGVVFIPVFSHLQLSADASVATSFAIQCFGMTAGSITWWMFYRHQKHQHSHWRSLPTIICVTVPFSVLGMLCAQFGQLSSPHGLHMTFGVFSIALATALFAAIPLLKRNRERCILAPLDYVALPLICVAGGVITAWLSVGVGELVAVYLLFRRFDPALAIACAVMLTGCSVWCGMLYHALFDSPFHWPIVAFAGLGAVVGGIIAKKVVLLFSATHLKLFFASWVMLTGLVSII